MMFPDLYLKAKELEEDFRETLTIFSYVLQNLSSVVAYFSQLSTSLPSQSFHYNTFKADYIALGQTVKQETYMPCLSLSFTSLLFSLLHPPIFF